MARIRRWGPIAAGAAALLVVWAWLGLGLRLGDLVRGWRNAGEFLGEAVPPDWSVLELAGKGLLETIQIAYLGTLLGLILSLPLALLAARNLAPWSVVAPLRVVLAAVRVLPSLLWALLFVVIVGPGPMAGVLAVGLYSAGYLGKLQYETLEGLPRESLEAARATGATRLQLARWVVLPEAANALVSQMLFMFEYNVRASTILGLVGAGGIGLYINRYLRAFQYDAVFTFLLVIFVAVVAIDWLSLLVRRRFLEDAGGRRRVRWVDVARRVFVGRGPRGP